MTTVTPSLIDDPWAPIRPARLSASRAKDFRKCPLAWKFLVVDKMRPPPTLAAVRGTLVHQVLENLYGFPAPQRTLPFAQSLIEQSWDECVQTKSGYGEWMQTWEGTPADLFHMCAELLAVYYTLEDPTRLPRTLQESDFRLDAGRVPILGYIDRIDQADDGLERIVDYKTGKKPLPAYEDNALWQLKLYALARLIQTDRLPGMVRLVYLGERRGVLDYRPTVQDMDEFFDEVDTLWDSMLTAFYSGVFPATPGKLCGWCDFRDLCPAQK